MVKTTWVINHMEALWLFCMCIIWTQTHISPAVDMFAVIYFWVYGFMLLVMLLGIISEIMGGN